MANSKSFGIKTVKTDLFGETAQGQWNRVSSCINSVRETIGEKNKTDLYEEITRDKHGIMRKKVQFFPKNSKLEWIYDKDERLLEVKTEREVDGVIKKRIRKYNPETGDYMEKDYALG